MTTKPKLSPCCRLGVCGGCLSTFKTPRGEWVQCQCFCHMPKADQLLRRLVERWRQTIEQDEPMDGGDAVEWLVEFWADADLYLREQGK